MSSKASQWVKAFRERPLHTFQQGGLIADITGDGNLRITGGKQELVIAAEDIGGFVQWLLGTFGEVTSANENHT